MAADSLAARKEKSETAAFHAAKAAALDAQGIGRIVL